MSDEQFEELFSKYKEKYFEYLDGNSTKTISTWNIMRDMRDMSVSREMLIKYLCTKHEIEPEKCDIGERELGEYIYSYIYFGTCPQLLSESERKRKGYVQHYFMWKNINDVKTKKPPVDLEITSENFKDYRITEWSDRQYRVFFTTQMLPELLQKMNIGNINIINNKSYSKILDNYAYHFKSIVKNYIVNKNYNIILAHVEPLEKIIRDYYRITRHDVDESKQEIADIIDEYFSNNNLDEPLLDILVRLKVKQESIKIGIKHKMEKIFKPQINNRYKWGELCKVTGMDKTFSLEELQELAIMERIPFFSFMSKRELCAEFSKKFNEYTKNINKSKKELKCQNTTTLLGTDINDIPNEFFYSYTDNNRVYCDDIRDIVKQIKNKNSDEPDWKNAYTNTPISTLQVKNALKWYRYINSITTTMEDNIGKSNDAEIPLVSQLTATTTDFISKLYHPNSGELFINASKELINIFVLNLKEEGILSIREIGQWVTVTDLIKYKLLLLQSLLLKIQNSPTDGRVNEYAVNITNVYNNTFKDSNASDSGSDSGSDSDRQAYRDAYGTETEYETETDVSDTDTEVSN